MAIVVSRQGKQIKVRCEECGLHLCPMTVGYGTPQQDESKWEARHPTPNDASTPELKKFYDCINQGKVVKGDV